ncbi:FAD-dependent oxidoreductase [Streptomyces sp. NPDC006798]|uniref:FAD-dependent monooxygenase n=1 Tax=Streptomyces sp. NPDC006798 TaxID=3155462 RepID=UPI0034024274
MNRRPRVLVLGGGAAGMLAAASAAALGEVEITVLERDELPAGPGPRPGVPQARHAHIVWSAGVRVMAELVTGLEHDLFAAGAHRMELMRDLVSMSPPGPWFARHHPSRHYILACSRDLLDAELRRRVLARPGVRLSRGTALGLTGDAGRVTGVRVRTGAAEEETIAADLVVDATGRGSRGPGRLTALGLPRVAETTVDSGVVYATRIFRAPATAASGFPVVNVQANPRRPPGQGGVLIPIEDGRWLVTLAGTRGGRPSGDPGEFTAFARRLRNPVIGDLIAAAEALTDVAVSHSTANRRRFYERIRQWPDGFVVLGDAVATFNPVYGHGLSVAARGALAMAEVLRRYDPRTRGAARRIQRAVAGPVASAWNLATGQDAFYPGASARPPGLLDRGLARYLDRVVAVGAVDSRVMLPLLDVMTTERPPTRLLYPDVLLAAAVGPRRPGPKGPTLEPGEFTAAGTR